MIQFKNIYKEYEGGNLVLNDINLKCESGKITVLIGPSGCGKTTTMKLINRLINPTKGQVLIDGEDISNVNPVDLRRKIGYVIQHIGLFPHMTIAQNVSVVPRLLKWEKSKIEERVNELMEMVGLDPEIYRDRYPSELSGGQQQRIGVIRALAAEPSIILMDEPFSALDPISREQLQDELNRLQQEINKTIIFVTHDMDEALKIADYIALMKDGEIVQYGTPENILRHPANDFVAEFIGQKRMQQVQGVPEVKDVMSKRPVTVQPHRGLAESIRKMEDNRVDTLIVTDEKNVLLGYVTVFDIVNNFDNDQITIGDITHRFNHTVKATTKLSKAITLMNSLDVPYVPVIDDGGYLDGLLTRGSIVGYMDDAYSNGKEGVV